MIALLPLLFSLAHAGGTHAGIPVHGVAGLGEPTFLTPKLGWSAAVEGGWTKIFVGATEAEAAEWYARQREGIVRTPDALALDGVDEAHGDGALLVMFRDGNVGVVVRVQANALDVATKLRAAIVDAAPRVKATLAADGPAWRVTAPGAVAIRSAAGLGDDGEEARFAADPGEVYVWDAYGRVQTVRR